MNREKLISEIKRKNSLLCVGLDTDMEKLPNGIERSMAGILEFNKQIIEATNPYAIAYKINTAFYEQYGAEGWQCMADTLKLIPNDCLTIADAKRGDIGNTSSMYAKAFFKNMNFDAITVAPYMGEDSLSPFFQFENKWVICLGLTSNAGSKDFQILSYDDKPLYETVMEKVSHWGNENNLMFVTGATKASDLKSLRAKFPQHFFLVPGVGAQGGTVKDVCDNALTDFGGLLINASRSILYASSEHDFKEKAQAEAITLRDACALALKNH
ncbi:MAG: orotidine-5'-phosphate decarboxylase [Bacteroidia bacterium]|nr:orotidine-5'-phosphate decarboxylase [Bacteroidia bacterium]